MSLVRGAWADEPSLMSESGMQSQYWRALHLRAASSVPHVMMKRLIARLSQEDERRKEEAARKRAQAEMARRDLEQQMAGNACLQELAKVCLVYLSRFQPFFSLSLVPPAMARRDLVL